MSDTGQGGWRQENAQSPEETLQQLTQQLGNLLLATPALESLLVLPLWTGSEDSGQLWLVRKNIPPAIVALRNLRSLTRATELQTNVLHDELEKLLTGLVATSEKGQDDTMGQADRQAADAAAGSHGADGEATGGEDAGATASGDAD